MELNSKLPFINLRSSELSERMPTPKKTKILMVDNDPKGRKARINILKSHGFSAYPALDMKQATTRCKPGAFDLIVVNPRHEKELALEFCNTIKRQNPDQLLLLMTTGDSVGTGGADAVSDNPQKLLDRVQAIFTKQAHAADIPVAA
jgi:DNA-binding response OmpR family regulator